MIKTTTIFYDQGVLYLPGDDVPDDVVTRLGRDCRGLEGPAPDRFLLRQDAQTAAVDVLADRIRAERPHLSENEVRLVVGLPPIDGPTLSAADMASAYADVETRFAAEE